jgi:hypothetical protein
MRFSIAAWVRLGMVLAVLGCASCAGPADPEEECDPQQSDADRTCPEKEKKDWEHHPSRPYRQPPSVPPDDSRVPGSY